MAHQVFGDTVNLASRMATTSQCCNFSLPFVEGLHQLQGSGAQTLVAGEGGACSLSEVGGVRAMSFSRVLVMVQQVFGDTVNLASRMATTSECCNPSLPFVHLSPVRGFMV